jgi:hypothetical protein
VKPRFSGHVAFRDPRHAAPHLFLARIDACTLDFGVSPPVTSELELVQGYCSRVTHLDERLPRTRAKRLTGFRRIDTRKTHFEDVFVDAHGQCIAVGNPHHDSRKLGARGTWYGKNQGKQAEQNFPLHQVVSAVIASAETAAPS